MSALKSLIDGYAQPGTLHRILIRPERRADCVYVDEAEIGPDGLAGDHARPGKRAVTLIQQEHLAVIGAMLGREAVDATTLRRNLVVSGLNLNALKGREISVGAAVLEITGICAPCSRMEAALGNGGYSAMRGHGGWCATITTPGKLCIGDPVTPLARG